MWHDQTVTLIIKANEGLFLKVQNTQGFNASRNTKRKNDGTPTGLGIWIVFVTVLRNDEDHAKTITFQIAIISCWVGCIKQHWWHVRSCVTGNGNAPIAPEVGGIGTCGGTDAISISIKIQFD